MAVLPTLIGGPGHVYKVISIYSTHNPTLKIFIVYMLYCNWIKKLKKQILIKIIYATLDFFRNFTTA